MMLGSEAWYTTIAIRKLKRGNQPVIDLLGEIAASTADAGP